MSNAKKAYCELPFSQRWNAENEHALKGGGWHVHTAPSQYGKTTANRGFVLAQRAHKSSDGQSSMPVVQTWATDRKNILRGIAECIGGERMANQPNRELLIPRIMARLRTREVIVNNGHNMDWKQWRELLDLDEICWGEHGFRPAVVLSGVQQHVGVANPPKGVELVEQIHKRITCYLEVPGHDRDETKVALQVLCARDCPELAKEVVKHAGTVFKILTEPVFDRWARGTVGAGDLVELVRRVGAARQARPQASIRELINLAAADYRIAQTDPTPDPNKAMAKLAAVVAA
jgi:hypothetical protein